MRNKRGDNIYSKKYRGAAARVYSNLPGIESIIYTLEGAKARDSAPFIRQIVENNTDGSRTKSPKGFLPDQLYFLLLQHCS